MSSSWRAFSYIMSANIQAVFLFLGAQELSEHCKGGGHWLCGWESFFVPFALVVAAFVYYKVLVFLVRSEKTKKKDP